MTTDWNEVWPNSGAARGVAGTGAFDYVALKGTTFVVPKIFDVFYGDPRLQYDVEVSIFMDAESGPRCHHIDVQGRPDGPEVTNERLRSIPIASLMQQGARFMAMQPSVEEDGSVRFVPARLSAEGRAEVTAAWQWAKAAPRRESFPVTQANLRLIGRLVKEALKKSEVEKKRPTVYASVETALKGEGFFVSRATVQRRIKEAQDQNLAPRWVKEES
jgi:hypothetical protein